jgi:transposase
MAAERHRMRDIREIFRLRYVEGKSHSQIATSVGIGKTTVADYLARAKSAGLDQTQITLLDDEALYLRLGFKGLGFASSVLLRKPEPVMPNWIEVHAELSKPSVTMMLLWTEYRELHSESGYGYTQYCEHYKRWSRKLSVVMRQNHKAGEKCFVDYCDGLWLVDPASGERHRTQLFVGCLGASSYTFAEVTLSQKLPDWIGSHCRMWNYFDGVTELTVPDNLRSGVSEAHRYEPKINDTYMDMARHYGTCIIPARSAKPRDKAKVEANVLVAQRWILARLRNQIFTDINEMNSKVDECLEWLNNRKMRHAQKSRRDLYLELDQPALKSLPVKIYEYAEWKEARVNIDYHVTFDFHHYSVPYQLVHELMSVRATATTIEVYRRGQRVACHVRSHRQGKATTNTEHMPKSHRAHAEWTPSRVISWSTSLGPDVGCLVAQILEARAHPEQGFRSALGIIRLEKKYGRERLNRACARAIEVKALSYRFVNEMLKNKMDFPERGDDRRPMPPTLDSKTNEVQLTLVGAENIRGPKYYH